MPDKKLTDKDITKYFNRLYIKLLDVKYELKITQKEFLALNEVHNLITRQQAEIEALIAGQETLQKYIAQQQARIDEFMKETAVTTLIDDAVVYTPTLEDYNKFKKKFKSEAVKEFVERLKYVWWDNGYESPDVDFDDFIDNLVKEIVGENNE